jgi:dihydropteroate synthase
VLPVVESLASVGRVSIDTTKPEVAEAAIRAGATLVNDISGSLWPIAAAGGVGWVAMHMQGTPADMQREPRYDRVVDEVLAWCVRHGEQASAAGVPDVWIDPGIGFGKTTAHNLELLANLRRFVATGFPVLVGVSRKRFLGEVTAFRGVNAEPGDRLEASLAAAAWSICEGADMVRVHDVAPTVAAVRLVHDDVSARQLQPPALQGVAS